MRLTERFHEALGFASRLHAGQTRKGSDTPSIAHLLAVTALVLEHGGTEDEAIAALLHDAVEDQGGAPVLAAIVAGCTDIDEIHKPSWRPRKERYLADLARAPYSVRLVVTADKLHNARSVLADYHRRGEALWTRFTGRREGTLWFYRSAANVLTSRLRPEEVQLRELTAELDSAVSALERAVTESAPARHHTPVGT